MAAAAAPSWIDQALTVIAAEAGGAGGSKLARPRLHGLHRHHRFRAAGPTWAKCSSAAELTVEPRMGKAIGRFPAGGLALPGRWLLAAAWRNPTGRRWEWLEGRLVRFNAQPQQPELAQRLAESIPQTCGPSGGPCHPSGPPPR